jgi:hypothetical protein
MLLAIVADKSTMQTSNASALIGHRPPMLPIARFFPSLASAPAVNSC